MKINIRDNTTGWAACAALASISDEIMKQVEESCFNRDGMIDVELKINGVDVPFDIIINRLKDEAVRWSYANANIILHDRAEILNKKLRNMQELAQKLEDSFKSEANRLFPENDD